jgi:Tol biopolymer transport system component
LDGSEELLDFEGAWPNVSSDGREIVYSGGEGLMIYSIENGSSIAIENTKMTDYAPVWSPDGEWIAFKDVENGRIAKIRIDGSELSEVYDAEEVIHPMQWLGEEIFYEAFANGGVKIKAVNVVSGAVREVVQTEIIKANGNFAVSSDGEWIAYDDAMFGQYGKGIYLQKIGSEERELLVDLDDVYVFVGGWSYDGKWLAVTIYGPEPELLPVLINVETKEVIALTALHGEVISWEIR